MMGAMVWMVWAVAAVPMSGDVVPQFAELDTAMEKFITDHQVPGASVAVMRNGKMVYSRGFGYSDRDAKTVMQPDDRFRIASISKPITAVAVMQLAEQGAVQLDEPILPQLGLTLPPKGDERWKTVTVRQMLNHTGGWDRDASFDPMFRPAEIAREMKTVNPATPVAVIRYMLKRPLDFDPGTKHAYSNFGYCMLGRLIERATKQKYETYVNEKVLMPVGAKDMQLGRSLLSMRAPREVRYYMQVPVEGENIFPGVKPKTVVATYGGWHLEAMDAHGGWIASAPDLVRFAQAFADEKKCPILKESSIKAMLGKAEKWPEMTGAKKDDPVYYGCGWSVRPFRNGKPTYWHSGHLDGTATILVHRADGWTFAVLFNTDTNAKKEYLIRLVEPVVHDALTKIGMEK